LTYHGFHNDQDLRLSTDLKLYLTAYQPFAVFVCRSGAVKTSFKSTRALGSKSKKVQKKIQNSKLGNIGQLVFVKMVYKHVAAPL